MEITFKSKKLKRQLTQPKELNKSFGQMAKKISQRIEEFKAAESLYILNKLPGTRCHEYSGDRKGEFSVNITGNYRIIFEPDHEPIPKKKDGGIDWNEIIKIKILYIEDPH